MSTIKMWFKNPVSSRKFEPKYIFAIKFNNILTESPSLQQQNYFTHLYVQHSEDGYSQASRGGVGHHEVGYVAVCDAIASVVKVHFQNCPYG